jgi:hypothetical protein
MGYATENENIHTPHRKHKGIIKILEQSVTVQITQCTEDDTTVLRKFIPYL